MISSQDIRTVTFEKSMRGYRTEDVDSFLQQVADTIDMLTKEKEDSQKKLYILAQKIEEYRKDEDNLKTALLNAQRMGENVIHEAKQKAEEIIRKARIGAEDITRQAHEQVQEESLEYQRISAEVAAFKTNVLNLYRQHIESLSTLPGREEEKEEEELTVAPQEEPAAEPSVEPADPEPNPPQAEPEPWVAAESAAQNTELDEQEFGTEINFAGVTDAADEPDEEDAPPEEPSVFDGFQGIKFSD